MIHRRLNFICRRFRTLCSTFIGGVSRKNNRGEIIPAYTAYKDGTDYSETSAYKIQRSGNHPKETIPHLHHSENFSDTMQRLRFLCSQNAVYFVTSSFFVHERFTFYIKDVPKFKCPALRDKMLKHISSATRNTNR